MPEAYIYDHVRTPRGRGKPDGALHEVTALALATAPLKALKERNNLAENVVDDVILGVVDPGGAADLIATKDGFSRDDVDAYAVQSQQRAAKAWDEGRFKNSVVPVKDVNGLTILAKDEHMRPSTTMQSLGQLQPSFVTVGQMGGFDAVAIQSHPEIERINYVHHAGNSSGIVDGAGAVLLGS